MKLQQRKNKNYLRHKINYNNYIILLQNVEWVLGNLRKKSDEINALFAGKMIDRLGV